MQHALSISAVEKLNSFTWRGPAAAWSQQREASVAALAAQREAGVLAGPLLLPGREAPYRCILAAKVRRSMGRAQRGDAP